MYAVLSPDGGNSNSDDVKLVRIEPPTGDTQTTFTEIADLPSDANPSKSVNSGTYIEINGVPHLAMANNTGRANSYLYNLNTGEFSTWMSSKIGGTVKDIVWLRNPITHNGVTYNMIGVDQNNSHNTMLFNPEGQFVAVNTEFVDTPGGWQTNSSHAFGVGGSFGSVGGSDAVFFTRNDGHLFEWEWDNGQGKMTWQGNSTPSSDNDGASCGSMSIDPVRKQLQRKHRQQPKHRRQHQLLRPHQ